MIDLRKGCTGVGRVFRRPGALVLTALILSLAGLRAALAGGWSLTGSLGTARYGHTATLLNTGQVLVAGGWGASGYLASSTTRFRGPGLPLLALWARPALSIRPPC